MAIYFNIVEIAHLKAIGPVRLEYFFKEKTEDRKFLGMVWSKGHKAGWYQSQYGLDGVFEVPNEKDCPRELYDHKELFFSDGKIKYKPRLIIVLKNGQSFTEFYRHESDIVKRVIELEESGRLRLELLK